MKIHLHYCCYVFINCVLIPSLLSKSISLNDLIAAEEKSSSVQLTQIKPSDTKTNDKRDFPKNHKFSTSVLTKHINTGSVIPLNKLLSPLKYKKTFQIRTPLRPKRLKYSGKRTRRLNPTIKREVNDYEKLNRNYIPLLKSLGVFFNNILSSDSREDDGPEYGEYQSITSEECPCAFKRRFKTREPGQTKKTIISSTPISAKIPSKIKALDLAKTTSTATNLTFNPNNSSVRRNKDLPVLPTRNTVSSRRNHNGFNERSLTAHNRNFERYIARNNGSNENIYTRGRETKSYTEDNKGNTDSIAGNDASCNGSSGTIGGDRNITKDTEDETLTSETDVIWSNETTAGDRGDSDQFKGFDKLENRRNETESGALLLQLNSRLRGYKSQEESEELLWQVQSSEESTFNVTNNITSNQRIPDGNGSMAKEDKELRRSNKTLTLDNNGLPRNLINISALPSAINEDKHKIVMIYDGYSIARDVNGDNKLIEKAYRIHS